MVQSLKSPWVAAFDDFAESIRESAIIAAPFITRPSVERLTRHLRRRQSVRLAVLTNLHPDSLVAGSVDSGALAWLCEQVHGTTVHHLPGLHAKAYVADAHTAIVTSANLTTGGLQYNYELGVVVTNPQAVSDIAYDLQEYSSLGSIASLANLAELDKKAKDAQRQQEIAARAVSDAVKTDFHTTLASIDAHLKFLRTIPGESTTAIFARAVRYILQQHGPMRTTDINPLVQGLLPDMCDDSVDRIINGVSFGRRWKHQVRNAQVQLRRDGTIILEGSRWRLTNGAKGNQ